MIRNFLSLNLNNRLFIVYKNVSLSRRDFVKKVLDIAKQIKNINDFKEYIYINIDNVIDFYIVLLACWLNNIKVVLPTKISLSNNQVPEYAKYILNYENDKIDIKPNESYRIRIDIGDTVIFSSGSTGVPKGIVHKKDSFFMNAIETLKLLDIKEETSITFLKPYLVSAISHFLVHWYSNSLLIFEDYEDINNIKEFQSFSNNLNVVGSPIHILSSIQYIKDYGFKPNFFFSSGDMMNDEHIRSILKYFSESNFFRVYGLAEVAGRLFIKKIKINDICYDIGQNLPNIDVEYIDNEVVVNSNILFLGYIKDNKYIKRNRAFFTGDLVSDICNEKKVLIGRKNDEIKIAGNKVVTKYLENLIFTSLKNIIDIELVIIVPIPHELFGNILALVFVTNNSSLNYNKNEITKILRKDLKSYEVPHKFYSINKEVIPFTQSMKIDRNKIKELIINDKIKEIN